MARAIVHVGLPKTGTTSIQVFLKLNRAALEAQGLIYMPPRLSLHSQIEYAFIGCSEAGALVPDHIEKAVRKIETLEDQRAVTSKFEERLAEELAAHPEATFVISCEQIGAYLRTPELRGALDRWLRARFSQVQYILYIRPMEEFFLSIYSEAVKRGHTGDLDSFIATANELPMAKTARDWSAQFPGRVAVRLKPANGAEIFAEFAGLLGLPMEGLVLPKPHNTALSRWEAAWMRKANRILGPADRRGRGTRYFAHQVRRAIRLLVGRGPKLALSPCERALINMRFPVSVEKTATELRERGWTGR